MSELWIVDFILLLLVAWTALLVLGMRNLFSATMVLAIYTLLMSLNWLNLDAVDVAFTEAAVGAGISTLLFIAVLVFVGDEEKPHKAIHLPALLTVICTAGMLIYGTLDMPHFGSDQAPGQTYVAPEYIQQTVPKADESFDAGKENFYHGHVPNLVTSVIVDYRAFDTMFEVAVIFTAGMSVIILMRYLYHFQRRQTS